MMTREQLKERYDAIHEHFNFKDFLGFSALIFGLLMANTSFEPQPSKNETIHSQELTKKSLSKKLSAQEKRIQRKRKAITNPPKRRRQQVTAARNQ